MQIVYLLRSGGKDDYERLMDNVGWMEFLRYPKHNLELRIAEQNSNRDRVGLSNQQWFTHQAPQGENLYGLSPDKHPNIKYICIVRNGREVVRSFFPFVNAINDQMRDLWGGFPPRMDTPQSALEMMITTAPDFYFGHAESWYAWRRQPNVLLLHFADVLKDRKGAVSKIARFLGIELKGGLLDVVLAKSSHSYMQARPEKFVNHAGYPGRTFVNVEQGKHIRKGGGRVDGAPEFFTADMNAQWEAAVKRYWGDKPGLAEWALNGGDLR